MRPSEGQQPMVFGSVGTLRRCAWAPRPILLHYDVDFQQSIRARMAIHCTLIVLHDEQQELSSFATLDQGVCFWLEIAWPPGR